MGRKRTEEKSLTDTCVHVVRIQLFAKGFKSPGQCQFSSPL